RIVIDQFTPNRSQKRAFKQHQNLITHILPVDFYEDHYTLYMQYQRARHDDGVKLDASADDETEIEQYRNFLCQSNVESVLVEFRDQEQNKLVMVSVIDIVRDGISAVYTFYDTTI
ncbi:MAG: arginyltransferase, partial [Methylotenera sp.]